MNCPEKIKLLLWVLVVCSFCNGALYAQVKAKAKPDNTYKPLKLGLNESGSKYVRFIFWNQVQLNTGNINNNSVFSVEPRLRRSRLLAFAQIEDKFLVLFHFGINNLTPSNAGDVRSSGQSALFVHDAWGEVKISKQLYIGGGLHYWRGVSRMNNQSTLNMLSTDNIQNPAWQSLGLTDQFARHLGGYVKGSIGKLGYRVAFNGANRNNLDNGAVRTDRFYYSTAALYGGVGSPKGSWLSEGYFEYNFLDKEGDKLPYKVGTYLGKKKVFNIGFGYFVHPDGTIKLNNSFTPNLLTEEWLDANTQTHTVVQIGGDAYFDGPVGKGALNAYLGYVYSDYGAGFARRPFTGSLITGILGYVLPKGLKRVRVAPYIVYNVQIREGQNNAGYSVNPGLGLFFNGHHHKLNVELPISNPTGTGDPSIALGIQYMVFL